MPCLRMAIEMGCKPDAVIGKASELMNFVTSGALPSPQGEAPADPIAAAGAGAPPAEAKPPG